MEKKLHRVKVILYVMAENESDACLAATKANFDIFECRARKADRLESGWEDAVPYNADGERTCAEILVSQQQTLVTTVSSTVQSARQTRMHTTPAVSYTSR